MSSTGMFGAAYAQQIKLTDQLMVNIHSVTEQMDRSFYIQLPRNYGKVNKQYPLIILLDAQDKTLYNYTSSTIDRLTWTNDIPEAIFIGIVQKDRSKELSFEGNEKTAAMFLTFIKDELIHYLHEHYALNGHYTLIGHSLGGQFVTNAMLTYPETFRSIISISGALSYPKSQPNFKRKVLTKLANYLAINTNGSYAKQKYYFSTGDEDYQESMFKIGALAADSIFRTNKTNSINWHFDYLKGFNHATTPLVSIPSGLTFIFHDWHFSDSLAMDVLLNHKTDPLQALNQQAAHILYSYGTEISIAAIAYYQFADYYLSKGEVNKAEILINRIINLYPNNDESYSLMAQVFIKKGEVKNAIKYLELAQTKSSVEKYAEKIKNLQKL
ncbi:alpha/beta fold hydrolase [Pedobacter sp. MC2016-24]|uniref:alpha/beta fold hydrolase n=1 Tax=Pedobacter sp. MC2016-24 TaxID=2780090 RepID=UPI0018829222|nr:hypothetical protein [Pedobacter sp. MC2016-24]